MGRDGRMVPSAPQLSDARNADTTTRSTMNRRTYTVTEAARILGISRSSAYEAVRRGEIASITIGHRIVIARATIDELLGDASTSRVGDDVSAA
jgi:excisionase family DNA binding protein